MEADIAGSPELIRQAALAVYLDYDWDLMVLDLCFDSLVDTAAAQQGSSRSLRFVRGGCRVEFDVRGVDRLSIDLGIHPRGEVTVAALGRDTHGTMTVATIADKGPTDLPPGLTSLLLRWPDGEHPPARTAWVVL
ncbi:MAG: hypothetical protein ACRDMV_16375 [Streptosporangiales bacterium]